MRVSLIRHTSVVVDGNVTCYGFTDVDVSANFQQEADALKLSIAHLTPEVVYTSPLKRAKQLAHYVGFTPIIEDDRLKELNFGDLEMRPWEEILRDKDPEIYFDHHINHSFPNGESLRDQQARVKAFLDERKAEGRKHIMVFCHGGVINCVRSLVDNMPLSDAFAYLPPFATHILLEY